MAGPGDPAPAIKIATADKSVVETRAAGQGTSPWSFRGLLRLRGEYLADSYRLVAPDTDAVAVSRLELALRYRAEHLEAEVEVQDSRIFGDRSLTPVGTDDVNALEPIQLWIGRSFSRGNGRFTARLGRMTLDFGSRRLLARNRFRNTSNAFQGGLLRWQGRETVVQGFYFLPLQREPNFLDREGLRGNEFALDHAGSDEQFAGLTLQQGLPGGPSLEAYAMHRYRHPRSGRPLTAQDIWTLGGRLSGERDSWYYDIEAALQFGDSSQLALADAPMLTHAAWFSHASLGRQVAPGLTLEMELDLASGDRDPTDGRNERFDRLYGARASELGPSGIFGVAIRSNQQSAALRLRYRPGRSHEFSMSVRALRLDSAADALVGSGRRDITGASGRDIGTQWEARYRRSFATGPATSGRRESSGGGTWSLEAGVALLDFGSFFRGSVGSDSALLNPPLAAGFGRYAFTQLSFRF